MKQSLPLAFLFTLLFFSVASHSFAQISKKDWMDFQKKYEAAYNAKDANAFKPMYAKDAVRTNPDGSVNTGNDAIIAALVEDFKGQEGTPKLTLTTDNTKMASDGTATVTGTWRLISKDKKTGQAYDVKGKYTNTVIKEDGTWKITNSVVTMEQ